MSVRLRRSYKVILLEHHLDPPMAHQGYKGDSSSTIAVWESRHIEIALLSRTYGFRKKMGFHLGVLKIRYKHARSAGA